MMRTRLGIYISGGLLVLCAAAAQNAQSQQKPTSPNLTPREIYYLPPKKAPAAVKTPTTPQATKGGGTKAGAAPRPATPAPAAPVASNRPDRVNPPTAPIAEPAPRTSNEPLYQTAAYTPAPYLGLRYSLLKHMGDDRYAEVDVDTVFRSGDSIRLSIEVNDDAYVYIVNKGSSGTWKVLFPSKEINNGRNHVRARERVEIPAGARFTFDDTAGAEGLFIVVSREAEPDLERLIYSLDTPASVPQRNEPPRRNDAPKPSSAPAMLMVQNIIQNDLVDKLRLTVRARDLVVEKVNDSETPKRSNSNVPPRPEKAAYVVNSSENGSKVVADLSLHHAKP